jgi:gas vesicle protein
MFTFKKFLLFIKNYWYVPVLALGLFALFFLTMFIKDKVKGKKVRDNNKNVLNMYNDIISKISDSSKKYVEDCKKLNKKYDNNIEEVDKKLHDDIKDIDNKYDVKKEEVKNEIKNKIDNQTEHYEKNPEDLEGWFNDRL